MRFLRVFTIILVLSPPALAHIGAPVVKTIRFPENRPESFLLVVDNVGMLAPNSDGLTWLCDEAMTTAPGFNDLIPLNDDGRTWVASTRQGLVRSIDDGCHFEPVAGILTQHVTSTLLPHPVNRNEALVSTQTLGLPNDVFRTEDAGETWSPANLSLDGRVRSILRSQSHPERVYLVHSGGGLRSDDGGRSFQPFPLTPMGVDGVGTDIDLLAIHPQNSDEIWSVLVQFPESLLLRSRDGGESWVTVTGLEDVPETMVFSFSGERALISMPFAGVLRSEDSGETWLPTPLPEPGLWLSCLSINADGEVWSCVRRGDSLVLKSPDFGDTWETVSYSDFSDISVRWACESESLTNTRCAEACDRTIRNCTEADSDAGISTMPDAQSGIPTPQMTENGCKIGHTGQPHWLFFLLFMFGLTSRLRPL